MTNIMQMGLDAQSHTVEANNEAEFEDVEFADAIVAEAVRCGVMMFPTHRGFLKVVPPLPIDPQAALEAVDVIRDCFVELKNS